MALASVGMSNVGIAPAGKPNAVLASAPSIFVLRILSRESKSASFSGQVASFQLSAVNAGLMAFT
ncbi:hypothetical protein D9M68_976540 [compost metagenome]